MNATIARIVDVMFQDTEMTDEVQALHDEVMNNCQERFDDLRARGLSEDEAIGEVVESLKGMDEVIAQYPKKETPREAVFEAVNDAEEEPETGHFSTGRQIRELQVFVYASDVRVEPSEDGLAHVLWDGMENLDAREENGVLSIRQADGHTGNKKHRMTLQGENIKMDEQPLTLENLGSFIRSAVRAVSKQVSLDISWNAEQITVQLPVEWCVDMNIHTTSGDVEMKGISARKVVCDSSSGDVSIDEMAALETLRVSTSSGDIDVEAGEKAAPLAEVTLKTMSGDVDYSGVCMRGAFTSISGDVNVKGQLETVQMKSTSGDEDFTQWGPGLRQVECQSTSGDVKVYLPWDTCGVVANMRSVSGDCRSASFPPAQNGEQVLITAHTVSGDVRIEKR